MLRAYNGPITQGAQGGITDISGTPGSGTANTLIAKFAIAAAASAATITCSACAATTFIWCQVVTNDGTLKSVSVVPGAGSYVVTGNAAATGNTTIVAWLLN